MGRGEGEEGGRGERREGGGEEVAEMLIEAVAVAGAALFG
jgi:hypothetical protein